MKSKNMQLQSNSAGGIDITLMRDAGNPILILTGKNSSSTETFRSLQNLCASAIAMIKRKLPQEMQGTSKKKMELKPNSIGGIDLLIERDGGNPVLILTGNKTKSSRFWNALWKQCGVALEELKEIVS